MKTVYLKAKYNNGDSHVGCYNVGNVSAFMEKTAKEGEAKGLVSLDPVTESEYLQYALAANLMFRSRYTGNHLHLGKYRGDATQKLVNNASKYLN